MSRWQKEKIIVLEAAQKMSAVGMVTGTAGNISLRLPGEHPLLAITPSSRYYDTLAADDIQIVDFNGSPVEGRLRPSMETMLHISVYQARKDVHAVIHTHSVYASAMAVAGLEIPPILEDQVACLGGEIKLASYAISGSLELAKAVIASLGNRNGVLMSNHGALGTGRTMRDAFTACELIEKAARVYLLAAQTGTVNQLPPEALKAIRAIYAKMQEE